MQIKHLNTTNLNKPDLNTTHYAFEYTPNPLQETVGKKPAGSTSGNRFFDAHSAPIARAGDSYKKLEPTPGGREFLLWVRGVDQRHNGDAEHLAGEIVEAPVTEFIPGRRPAGRTHHEQTRALPDKTRSCSKAFQTVLQKSPHGGRNHFKT